MSLPRSSDHRFRTFVAAAPVGIYECDSEGGCLFVNKRWCALTGLTRWQAAGDGWVQAIHPEDHERVAAGWQHAMSTGTAFTRRGVPLPAARRIGGLGIGERGRAPWQRR